MSKVNLFSNVSKIKYDQMIGLIFNFFSIFSSFVSFFFINILKLLRSTILKVFENETLAFKVYQYKTICTITLLSFFFFP